MKKLDIQLTNALKDLYHNGTIPTFKNCRDSDFECDLFNSFLNDYVSMTIDDLKINNEPITKYGSVYQYGRCRWIDSSANILYLF